MAQTTCSVEGCERPCKARGWCNMHWQRWYRTLGPRPPRLRDVGERIEAWIVRSEEGCWLWQGRLDKDGYGNLTVGQRRRRAHRVSYEHFVGPIPEGLHIDHLCRVRNCVNPAHLEAVTCKENIRRGKTGFANSRFCPSRRSKIDGLGKAR